MPSMPLITGHSLRGRAQTWPQTARYIAQVEAIYMSDPISESASTVATSDFFESDLDSNPEKHFLSPIQPDEYEDWNDDDDDEDDGEDLSWDAGITDFALFSNDRRRAEENNQELPEKWQSLQASQASALQRSLYRRRVEPHQCAVPRTASNESMPDLTPDHSPNLRDDLVFAEDLLSQKATQHRPAFRVVVITPDSDIEEAVIDDDDDEDDLPSSFYVDRGRKQRSGFDRLKFQRPGLRYARTLSGQLHSWERPSSGIYSVGEEPEAERRAEKGGVSKGAERMRR